MKHRKGLYEKQLKKLIAIFRVLFLSFNFYGAVYASDLTSSEDNTESSQSAGDIAAPIINSEIDASFTLTFTRDKDGNFTHDYIGFYDKNSQSSTSASGPLATIDFYLQPIITPVSGDYYYKIMAKIQSNYLVNGTFGNLMVRHSNLLLPDIYFNQLISYGFCYSYLNYTEVGTYEIIPVVPTVQIKYTNCFMYFKDYEWVAGESYNAVNPVPPMPW